MKITHTNVANITARQIRPEDWWAYKNFYQGLSAPKFWRYFFKDKDIEAPETWRDLLAYTIECGSTTYALFDGDTMIAQLSIGVIMNQGEEKPFIQTLEIADDRCGTWAFNHFKPIISEHLRKMGASQIIAYTETDNRASLAVSKRLGFQITSKTDDGLHILTLDLENT